MSLQRILASLVFFLAGMNCAVSSTAQDEDIERWKNSSWRMIIYLDTPNLEPLAIQWTVLDYDPVPGYTTKVKRMKGFYLKQLEQAENFFRRAGVRSSHMTGSWNRGFKDVTGDEVYLLAGVNSASASISSGAPDGKKWIVTKTVQIKFRPVCWCIPVEVETGNEIQVTLTEENKFDLVSAFDAAMKESPIDE